MKTPHKIITRSVDGKVLLVMGDVAIAQLNPTQAYELCADIMAMAKDAKSYVAPPDDQAKGEEVKKDDKA